MPQQRKGGGRFVTSTKLLRKTLTPLIAELDKQVDARVSSGPGKDGGRALLAERAATYCGHPLTGTPPSPEALYRRIYAIMSCEFETTRIEIADALLLGCGVYIENTDLPTLPTGTKTAEHMVECYAQEKGLAISKADKKALASTLLDFVFDALEDPENAHFDKAPIPVLV